MRWRDGPQGRQVTFLPLAQEVARLRGPTCPCDLLACPHVNLPKHQWLSQALGQTWAQQDPQGQVLWALSGAIGPGARGAVVPLIFCFSLSGSGSAPGVW